MITTEYINIFNLCRTYTTYEIINYFKNFKKNYDIQNTNTTLNINEYITETQNISQELYIIFLFNIKTNKLKINTLKNKIIKNFDENIWNL